MHAPKTSAMPKLPPFLPGPYVSDDSRTACDLEALRRIFGQLHFTNAHVGWLRGPAWAARPFARYVAAAARVVALERILDGVGARQPSLWALLEERLRGTERTEAHAMAVHCLADPRMRTANRMDRGFR